MSEPITKRQIARIWASAHAIGMDREMLYLLVPRGSVSAMSKQEAAELIEHLNELAGRRVGPANPDAVFEKKPAERHTIDYGDTTRNQRNFIYFLLGKLGWLQEPAHVRRFLLKYAGVPSVERIRDRKRASAIIEALKAIYKRRRKNTEV